jgi:predicted secreted hydrolase
MARRSAALALALLVLGALAWGAVRLAGPVGDGEVRAALSAARVLAGSDTAGYARAIEPRPFRFPEDHGPHPEYRTEWWYLTGNLEAADGRPFAFQLTFFRAALAPRAAPRRSGWNTNQLWMAHFGLTDVDGEWHRGAERLARGAGGLAGASAAPFRVWVEDWELEGGAEGLFPLRLRAREGDEALELTLEEGKPVVLQGRDGLSQKGTEPGNASYYYSLTRIPARGTVKVAGERIPVEGSAWMDREWSTSALGDEHVGWDWFSLQLSDGRELMFFQLRRRDGTPDTLGHGALVAPDGGWEVLSAGEVEVGVLDRWESPLDGTAYPSGWRIRLPGHGVDLTAEPRIRDQEMNLTFRYWEGAVRVEGRGVDGPVDGHGFVELTGYAEEREPSARRSGEGPSSSVDQTPILPMRRIGVRADPRWIFVDGNHLTIRVSAP